MLVSTHAHKYTLTHARSQKLSSDDLISLDMSDFEHSYNESDFESVRRAMIDRNVDHQSLAAWLPVEREVTTAHQISWWYFPVLTMEGGLLQWTSSTLYLVCSLSAEALPPEERNLLPCSN